MPGSDGYRFRHILIRDVAYQRIAKQTRAELHERFADWIEAREHAPSAEYADIAGYHLEQALAMRRELGRPDGERPDLALRAGERLAVAGSRARAGWDLPAARSLLERAAGVLAEFPDQRLAVMLDLADTARWAGEEERATAILDEVLLATVAVGDPRLEARAALARATQFGAAPIGWDEVERVAMTAIEVFEREGDEQGQASAWSRMGWVHQSRGHYARAMDALEVALGHARSSGLVTEEMPIVANLSVTLWMGPLAAGRAIERCTTLREQTSERHPLVGAFVAAPLGVLQALAGMPDAGRATIAAARATIAEMHSGEPIAALLLLSGQVELLAGRPADAEPLLLESAEHYRDIGHSAGECDVAAALSQTMRMLGRAGEAASWAERSRTTAVADDRNNQIAWRVAVATSARDAEAAGEAVGIARECESPGASRRRAARPRRGDRIGRRRRRGGGAVHGEGPHRRPGARAEGCRRARRPKRLTVERLELELVRGRRGATEAGEMLAQTFHDDPFVVYALPDVETRPARLTAVFTWNVAYGQLYGRSLRTPNRLDGVVVLLPPSPEHFSDDRLAATGYQRIARAVGEDEWPGVHERYLSVFGYCDAAVRVVVPDDDWCLDVIGVDVARRGRRRRQRPDRRGPGSVGQGIVW